MQVKHYLIFLTYTRHPYLDITGDLFRVNGGILEKLHSEVFWRNCIHIFLNWIIEAELLWHSSEAC